ncbi:MAG: DUF456 family protein [Leptolyngbyaceae bacterium]|nr:DUF456 family protein [Leptolyngbyaceae bacterium]
MWQRFLQSFTDGWHYFVRFVLTSLHTVSDGIRDWGHAFWTQFVAVQQQLTASIANFATAVAAADLWLVVVYWLLLLVAIAGVIGAFVPALPGITLIVGAVIIWGLIHGFSGLGWAIGVSVVALLLSIAVDYLAGIIGAQKVGASQWGQIGAFVGMALGFFGLIPALPVGGPIFGILLGTVLGAFVGEFLHRRDLKLWLRVQQSFRVGIAIVVGTLVGNLLQGFLAIVAFLVFLLATWGSV